MAMEKDPEKAAWRAEFEKLGREAAKGHILIRSVNLQFAGLEKRNANRTPRTILPTGIASGLSGPPLPFSALPVSSLRWPIERLA
jgi:hypothetical protein